MKDKIIVAVAILQVLVLGYVFAASRPTTSLGGLYEGGNVFLDTSTSSVVLVGASDLKLLGTSSLRRFVHIAPSPTCVQGVYVSLSNDATASALNSIFVSASSSFQLNQTNLYEGAIHAIGNGGNCTLEVTAHQ